MKELKFVLTLNSKIISVNDLYKAKLGYKAGRPVPIIYKNPKAHIQAEEIKEQLRAIKLDQEVIDWLKKEKNICLTLQYVFKSGINSRDCSNMAKFLEDEITRFIKNDLGIEEYDDVRHVEVHQYKSIIPKSKHEYVFVQIGKSNHDTRFDKGISDKIEKVFIHGEPDSCLVKSLKSKNIKVEKTRKDPDADIIILSPKNSGNRDLILEAMKIANSSNGLLFIGIEESIDWLDMEYYWLSGIIRSMATQYSSNPNIKIGFIKTPEEVLDIKNNNIIGL